MCPDDDATYLTRQRRDVDDSSPLVRHHIREDGLRAQERAREVHRQDPIPLVKRHFKQRCRGADARAVDQDANGTESRMGSVHHAANRFGARYVDLNRYRPAAALPDLLDTCLGGCNGEVEQYVNADKTYCLSFCLT